MPRQRIRPIITTERIHELLTYEPDTGFFRWLVTRRGKFKVYDPGDIAGNVCKDGYWRISLDNIPYLGHRLAWVMTHGYWPEEIDHIDRVKSNNRLSNLKSCNRKENMQNVVWADFHGKNGSFRGNKTGLPRGVTKSTSGYTFRATHRLKHLGLFKTPEEASMVFEEAKRKFDGTILP